MACRTVFLIASCLAALGQQTPTLPRLPLDTYPPAMRDAVSRAYHDAETRPRDGTAAGVLARLLHAWEQWDAAHEAYSRAAALAPQVFDWPYLDACVLARQVRPAEAAARLREALAIRPDFLPARVKLADALLDAGHKEDSRAMFTLLLREPAAEPAAVFGLGRIAAADGNHEEAIARMQRAIVLFPEWGAAHYGLALSLRALGRREEAQQALARHAQFGTRWPAVEDLVLAGVNALRTDPGARLRRGKRLADEGDVPGAIVEYEAAAAADASLGLAHANLIKLYGRSRNWAKAEEHYLAALALGSGLAELHYDYGVLLGLQEQWEQAAKAYRKAIGINPLYSEAHNNLGQILERNRQFDAALDAYRHALDAQPTFRLARFNTGRMLIALNRAPEAVAVLAPLAEPRDADSARYVFALSAAHIRSGNKGSGIEWATEARRRAQEFGQHELAAAIERELAMIR